MRPCQEGRQRWSAVRVGGRRPIATEAARACPAQDGHIGRLVGPVTDIESIPPKAEGATDDEKAASLVDAMLAAGLEGKTWRRHVASELSGRLDATSRCSSPCSPSGSWDDVKTNQSRCPRGLCATEKPRPGARVEHGVQTDRMLAAPGKGNEGRRATAGLVVMGLVSVAAAHTAACRVRESANLRPESRVRENRTRGSEGGRPR